MAEGIPAWMSKMRERGMVKMTWMGQVEEWSVKVSLGREDVFCQSTWMFCCNKIVMWMTGFWQLSTIGVVAGFTTLASPSHCQQF